MNKLSLFLLSAGLASAVHAAQPATLATINGTPIRRSEAMDRAWKQFGTQVVNEMADEILIRQAASAAKVKADVQEIDARLKRIRDQFPDEKTFTQRLKEGGLSVAEVRKTIEDQVLREAMTIQAKQITMTEDELKALFTANKDRLGTPESVRLRYLAVASEKDANDFLVAIRAGADFAKLASQVSIDNATKPQGGDIGFIPRGRLAPEIEAVVFALKPGEVSAPVKAPFGWQVFKAEDRRPAQEATYEQARSGLAQALLSDKISRSLPTYLQELRAKAKITTPK